MLHHTAQIVALFAFGTTGLAAVADDTLHRARANIRHRKVGGIHFLRLGRWQFSYCKCRNG